MKIKLVKKQTIRKLLTLLGFSSTAFVFAACYGPLPDDYQKRDYADSIRTDLADEDTLIVESPITEVADSIE